MTGFITAELGWAVTLVAGIALGVSAAPPAPDAAALQKALAVWQDGLRQASTIASDFVQEKHLAIFRAPLVIRGRLFISDNGSFAWETHSPIRHKLVVANGQVRQWDEETRRTHTISMRDNPIASTIHTHMSAWFSGKFDALSDSYAIELAEKQPASFIFTPLPGSPAAGYLSSVQVWLRPDGRYLDKIQIKERSGDRTLITFTNTLLNLPLPEDTWRVDAFSPPREEDAVDTTSE